MKGIDIQPKHTWGTPDSVDARLGRRTRRFQEKRVDIAINPIDLQLTPSNPLCPVGCTTTDNVVKRSDREGQAVINSVSGRSTRTPSTLTYRSLNYVLARKPIANAKKVISFMRDT